jgi:hypothetical protein
MKPRLASFILLFALVSAFVLVPSGTAFAKNEGKAHPVKGVKAQGKFGDATVNVTQFAVNAAGQLVASGVVTSETKGTLGTFSDAPVTVQQQPGTCTILTLTIAPIYLNLLGLVIQTSEINLVITAETGPGNLLGNLLCALVGIFDPQAQAQALNEALALLGGTLGSGSPLTGALPISITSFAKQDGQLVAQFYVDGADGQAVGPFVTPAQVIEPPEGSCEILTLVLGPIDLNILGLRIQLFGETPEDPITILIYAVPGPGNLLGNLLCALVGILDPQTPAGLNQTVRLLNRILAALG